MVFTNSDTTRARKSTKTDTLDLSEPLIALTTQADRDRRDLEARRIHKATGQLTQVQQRVLSAVVNASLVSFRLETGYSYRPPTRAQIADQLGRRALVPYDINVLRQLVAARLIEEHKQALPRKQHGEIWLGAGMQFVYVIPRQTLVCLLWIDSEHQQRLKALRKQPVQAAAKYNPPPAPSMIDRIRELIGF